MDDIQQIPNSITAARSLPSKIQYVALALVLGLYLIVALAHAYLAPLTTGPDELAHYEYVRFIAEHGRLPDNNEERAQASYKSDQPPLYHLLAALPASLVDPAGPPFLKRVKDHNRRQLIERTRHAWGLYNTEDEQWPYRAEVLGWQVGRWAAILFGAAAVAVTFFIGRDLFTMKPLKVSKTFRGWAAAESYPAPWLLALSAAAIVAFIPRFALTGAMLNYETTLAFVAALFLWALLRVSQAADQPGRPASRFTFDLLLLGFWAGLAVAAKLSALILPLEISLALWLIKRYQGWTWRRYWRALLMTAVAALGAAGWWFGFILYQFNTVARDGWWVGLLRPLLAADSSDATTNRLLSFLTGGQAGFTAAIENLDSGPPWEWLAVFFRTFWVAGIEQVQPLGRAGLIIALALCLVAAAGLIDIWRRSVTPESPRRLLLSLLLLHLSAPLILPLLRYAVTFSLADTAQGRHVLFMAAPAFAILLVWGFTGAVFRIRDHVSYITPHTLPPTSYLLRLTPLLPPLFLFAWSLVQLWTMTWAYLPLLPVRTVPAAEAQAEHRLELAVNEFVTLVGYTDQLDGEQATLRLDLIWRATGISPADYLTEVSLLDGDNQVQAQWLGYSANGRYPTRAWDVGDIVRDTAWLPLEGLAPGQYQLLLNLIPARVNGEWVNDELVAVRDSLGPLPLTLTHFNLHNAPPRRFKSGLTFTGQALAAAGYSIWQNGEALSAPPTFRYRETILLTFGPTESDQQRLVRLAALEAGRTFAPLREVNNTTLFIVGPDWPGGDYDLQVSLQTGNDQEQQATSGPVLKVVDYWERQFVEPPMSRRVEANFANQVKLLGYDLGSNRAQPGGGIPVTLYWQGLDWMGADYTIFTRLLAADQRAHGGRDRLPREGYSTLYWAPGEIVTDPFGVPVDPDAPAGIYYLNVGLYGQVGRQAISLPLIQDGRPIEASSINIGPLKIGRTPPGLAVAKADPQVSLNRPFGEPPNLTLLGYDLIDERGQPISKLTAHSSSLRLTLYWRSESPLAIDYTTFVHLRNAAGETTAQQDQPPLQGAYPTSLWDPGEVIADTIDISLPAGLPAGSYQVVIGLYDFETGARLTIPGRPDQSLTLATLELAP